MLPNRADRFRQVLSVAALVGALILCAIPLTRAAETPFGVSSDQMHAVLMVNVDASDIF